LAGLGVKLLASGLAVSGLFFALAPRSPLYRLVGAGHPGLPGVLAGVAGVAGLSLVLAGYVVHLLESKPRPLAYYEAALLFTLLAWVSTGLALHQALLGHGLPGLLASLAATSPILAVLYLLILRPLERKARRAGRVIVVYRA